VKLWDVATGAERRALKAGDLRGLCASPDGEWLAYAAKGGVRLIRLEERRHRAADDRSGRPFLGELLDPLVRDLQQIVPQAFLREVGAGRVVYFPWDIDRTFWEVLAPDHLNLLRNAVSWATNEEPPVTVSGPGVVEVTVWRQRRSLTVHLVNLTNPMMMKGPVRELLPVGEQHLRVHLPDGASARRVVLLVGGGSAPFRQKGRWLETAVPEVLAHEVVAIDL
jgi:hypothetical protein